MELNTVKCNYVDLLKRLIYPAEIQLNDGIITAITPINESVNGYALPGFIDAHVHIESSMLSPSLFAPQALQHGTIATVSDPHEIANVLGKEGVVYMLDEAKKVPFHFFFGAPSCVPATSFETAGAELNASDVKELLERDDIYYLAEMMNWPGVLHRDPEVMAKIKAAHDLDKPVDGHAPGLKGEQAKQYAEVGISTDHECFSLEEAQGKIALGMHILIREGSAAKNFEALAPLIGECPEQVMFCSDDLHPDDLLKGHINLLIKRALSKGFDLFDVLQIACVNPVKHYKLTTGLLQVGDPANFIMVNNLDDFKTEAVVVNGKQVVQTGKYLLPSAKAAIVNQFHAYKVQDTDFQINGDSGDVRIIEAIDGELITNTIFGQVELVNGLLETNTSLDHLKLTVVNRYQQQAPAVAFIKGFGLKQGAIASSVGHDSHNITAVGVSDQALAKVVNAIMENSGGLAVYDGESVHVLPLPIAGLMSDQPVEEVGKHYENLSRSAKDLGSTLTAPFMTLSFMALLVIPELKLSDKGLFDGTRFQFVPLQEK
jgi:adenine deaminase